MLELGILDTSQGHKSIRSIDRDGKRREIYGTYPVVVSNLSFLYLELVEFNYSLREYGSKSISISVRKDGTYWIVFIDKNPVILIVDDSSKLPLPEGSFKGVWILGGPELKFLNKLKYLISLSIDKILSNVESEVISKLKNLTTLNIFGRKNPPDLTFLKDLNNLTNLKLIDYKTLENVDDIKNLTNINKLNLRNCYSVKNVDAIGTSTSISELHIDSCLYRDSLGVFSNLPPFTVLDISKCRNK